MGTRRRARRLTTEEIARNEQRLAAVNGWLEAVDLDRWHVGHAVSLDGYLMGVVMTHLADSYCILAQNHTQVRLIEAGWRGNGSEWPSADEAALILSALTEEGK